MTKCCAGPVFTVFILISCLLLFGQVSEAQMMGRGGTGRCPMCGQPWAGQVVELDIPDKLPEPRKEWADRLRQTLALEILSEAQYKADSTKYQAGMPYMMVIPQEENHIKWERELFSAYGLSPDAETPQIRQSGSLTEAYQIARRLEADLVPHYEWLIANAGDETSVRVIDTILRRPACITPCLTMPSAWEA